MKHKRYLFRCDQVLGDAENVCFTCFWIRGVVLWDEACRKTDALEMAAEGMTEPDLMNLCSLMALAMQYDVPVVERGVHTQA